MMAQVIFKEMKIAFMRVKAVSHLAARRHDGAEPEEE